MAAFPHPNSFSTEARARIWVKMQAEAEERMLHGKVVSGSGLGQSFSTQPLTNEEFFVIFNEWSGVIAGVNASTGGVSQTRPNFSGACR
jgi:hypothetical protein